MSMTLKMTFKGLCLFYLNGPTGSDDPPTAYDEVIVLLVNARKAMRRRPIDDCRGTQRPTLHRHEPYLCFDLEDWLVKGDESDRVELIVRPDGGQYAVYDPTGKDLQIELTTGTTGQVQVPQKGLKSGDLPDVSDPKDARRLDWIPSIEHVLPTTTSHALHRSCLRGDVGGGQGQPVVARIRLRSGVLSSGQISVNSPGSTNAVEWYFVDRPGGASTWSQGLAEAVSWAVEINESTKVRFKRGTKTVLELTPKTTKDLFEVSTTNLPVDYLQGLQNDPLHHFRWYYELLAACPANPSPIPDSNPPGGGVTGANAFCPPAKTSG